MNAFYGPRAIFILFSSVTLVQVFYYVYFFTRIAFYKPSGKQKHQQHPVSVIVCARDEAQNLAEKLPVVLQQQYPTTHEVIVVNDNSFDDTKYILEKLAKPFKHLKNLELMQEAKMITGKKFPLSMGIKSARHEILLLTDADCVPASTHWISLMQDGYSDNTEVVLGYGAYEKHPGLLNKLIRFETFHSALQYLSFAQAGIPYMGVGRNLSYKRDMFFRTKGFSAHNHIPGGDDDLFINTVANKHNTSIVIEPAAFTYSTPKKTWKEWSRQKQRHFTTSKYYKPLHKFLLGLYSASHFLFYPLLVASLFFIYWPWVVIVFGIRFLLQAIIYYKSMKRLQERDLFVLFPIFDLWQFIYYIIFAPSLWKRPKAQWK